MKIKDLLQCEESAFIMVTDDYGHCFCEVTGSKELGAPISAGTVSQWSDLLMNVKYLSYEDIPLEFKAYLRSIFDDAAIISNSLTIQPILGSATNGSSSIIAVLCILHSNSLSCSSSTRSKSFDDLLNLCNDTATSVIRICYSFEKQRSLTKLNGFILTLLRNVFSNLGCGLLFYQPLINFPFSCSLYLLDHDNNELVAEVVESDENQHEVLKEIRFPLGQGIAGQVAVSGNMINVKHYVPESRIVITEEKLSLSCARNVLCFAVKDKTAVIAVIQLVNKIDTQFYTDHDEHLAELLSSYCAISISHVRSSLPLAIAEEDVLRLSLCNIPEPSSIKPDFLSFSFSPRCLSLHETHIACLTIFDDLGFIQKFRIKRKKLSRFLLLVEHGYRDVPYHNWYHAFTVTHFCYLLQKKLGIMNIYLSDVQRVSLLVACLCHDIDHRGTNNSFQLQSGGIFKNISTFQKTALAQLYSSEGSVLECHHFAQTMCIFNMEECNIFAQLPSQVDIMFLYEDFGV
ncbi:unnamed protein product [Soboliphyme baturini]|uniref:Phosphodiesterase n=1 Tax=Soboliphyme baturini TaxID=241478 RepID=A0A183IU64_9BILA|nr:unnamed protein product [Soboliphyme baturini]